jgi:putative flavoprotein involved in K+ transport
MAAPKSRGEGKTSVPGRKPLLSVDGRGRYLVETDHGPILARQVVVAAGAFPRPRVLPASEGVPRGIAQVHSVDYKSPEALPPGAVLVVGSGQSGAQIAEELLESGRRVFLSLGSCARAPRRYRGKDLIWWLRELGVTATPIDAVPDAAAARRACKPYVSGKRGGHDIFLDELAQDGLQLVGRLVGIADGIASFRPSVNESLDKADAFAAKLLDDVDALVLRRGLDAPQDAARGRLAGRAGARRLPERERLDLRAEGIGAIVWATGFKPEFPWIDVPVFDAEGAPVHRRGVTASRGLYFLGLYWLHTMKSDALLGVGEDAAFLAERVQEEHDRALAAPEALD